MRKTFAKFSSAALAVVFAASLGAPVQAQQRSIGIPLQNGANCGIQVYLGSSSGIAVPRTHRALSGSYRFQLYQAMPNSDLDLRLDGHFSRSSTEDSVLAQSTFMLGYVVPGGYRGMDELRDAELGQDAMLRGSLQVYDTSGRLVCSTNQVTILPFQLIDSPRAAPRPSRYVSPYAPTEASQRVVARRAQQSATPSRTSSISREECLAIPGMIASRCPRN